MPRKPLKNIIQDKILFPLSKKIFKIGNAKEKIKIKGIELEILRLLILENRTQKDAAEMLNISQPTLHRIYRDVLRKISIALIYGKNIEIEGTKSLTKIYKCKECEKEYVAPFGEVLHYCPYCNSKLEVVR